VHRLRHPLGGDFFAGDMALHTKTLAVGRAAAETMVLGCKGFLVLDGDSPARSLCD
jgi:hypothetical protein